MQNAADGEAFVVVELLFKYASGDAAAVQHEIFTDDAAGVGQAVGELFIGGEQEQARGFGAVGADDDGFCFLQMRVALFVEVDGAYGAAVAVRLNAMDVGGGPDFAAAGFFSHGNGGGQGAGFRADFATESETEAAIDASA